MKKLMLTLFAFSAAIMLHAQTDSLQQYTGKFKFPEGSPVTEITVVLENGVLTATSAMGNSELKKGADKDVFEIVAYSGIATYKRNPEGKIISLQIQVQDINMEGTKEEGFQWGETTYYIPRK